MVKNANLHKAKNAITYKEFFPLLKDDEVWIGCTNVKEFLQPDGSIKKFDNIGWFTNLDVAKRHEKLILWKKYTPEEYLTYDNYDAINVDKVSEIPCDYDGVMSVPITFLDKYNPEQFEIIELSRYLNHEGMSKEFVDEYYRQGNKGSIHEGYPDLCYYTSVGKTVVPYMRVLIRKKAGA